jgi:hypothetical protein
MGPQTLTETTENIMDQFLTVIQLQTFSRHVFFITASFDFIGDQTWADLSPLRK